MAASNAIATNRAERLVDHFCFLMSLLTALAALCTPVASAQTSSSKPDVHQAGTLERYNELPLSFETNVGQTDSRVKFSARGAGYILFLTDEEAELALPKKASGEFRGLGGRRSRTSGQGSQEADMIRMQLVGFQHGVKLIGEDLLPGTVNYFLGNDSAKWLSKISTFKEVRSFGVYPGVDVVYHGNQHALEFDFLVAPGASAGPIRMRFAGAKKLRLDDEGNLIVSTKSGDICVHAPVVYQQIGGFRASVSARFRFISKTTIGFALGGYDHSRELVIDPVLVYSTYLGGDYFDSISALAVDTAGNAYVTGTAYSCDFPTTPGAFNTALPECNTDMVFVTKFNPSGSVLLYSTFLGFGYGDAIAVDGSGDAYVSGWTLTGFPVTPGAYQSVNNAAVNGGSNSFVTKLNPTGTDLVYSTYLGGSWGEDIVNAIAVDSAGNAFVAGSAVSTDFPATPGAFQTVDSTPGEPYSFVTKLNATGTALVYSSFLVGTGQISIYSAPLNVANGIAVDGSDNAYVVGSTADESFPVTPGAFQTNYSTDPTDLGLFRFTGYVTKFDAAGSKLIYSSYLGGGYISENEAVAVDSSGNAYVTGGTTGDFNVTSDAFQPQQAGLDAFVTKINPQGSALIYSSYLGGSCLASPQLTGDTGFGIALDSAGDAYVAGQTCSPDFPLTTGAIQTTIYKTSDYNAFLSEINPSGNALLYSTYLGGDGDLNNVGDWANGIAVDGSGNVYVAGLTHSSDFPTTSGAFHTTTNSSGAGFVSKFSIPEGATLVKRDFAISLSPASLSITSGQAGMTTVTITPQNGFYQNISLSCSGLPAEATCLFSSSLLSSGNGPATSTLTIQTTANVATTHLESFPFVSIVSLGLVICLWHPERRKKIVALGLVAGFIGATSLLNGCSGGVNTATNTNQYTVTIAAAATTVQHSATLTITLN